MKKKKVNSQIRIPKVKGFLLLRVRDLITFDIAYIVSKTPAQHESDFRLKLNQYLGGKNSKLQKAAVVYMIEDCVTEIKKSKGNPHKTNLLQLIHGILNAQLAGICEK